MYSLFVKMVPKPERLDALADEVAEVAKKVRTEPGCLAFEPFRPADGSANVMIFEKWTDRAAMETHEALPYMKDLYARLGGWLDGAPELTDVTPIGPTHG